MVRIVPVVFFGNKTCSVPGNPLSWTDCSTPFVILQSCSSAAIQRLFINCITNLSKSFCLASFETIRYIRIFQLSVIPPSLTKSKSIANLLLTQSSSSKVFYLF